MKAFAFCTSYINNFSRKHLWLRYKRWISYYHPLMDKLQVENLFLIDDASNPANFDKRAVVLKPGDLPEKLSEDIYIVGFQEKLGRVSREHYPGWWRSFLFSYKIAEKYGFEKIIHIESDFYILSDRLMEYIASLSSGWATLYTQHFQMPETALQIICRDAFEDMKKIVDQAEQTGYRFDDLAEFVLPFTHVEKEFVGDRVGEAAVYRAWKKNHKERVKADYLAQVKPYIKLGRYRSGFIF